VNTVPKSILEKERVEAFDRAIGFLRKVQQRYGYGEA
jgi:hypothetical protein